MPVQVNPPGLSDAQRADKLRASYDLCHDEIIAQDPNTPFTFDPVHAVTVISRASEQIAALNLPLGQLITFDAKYVEKMVVYAQALSYIQAEIDACSQQKSQLAEQATEAYKLRSLMFAYADVLCMANLMDPQAVAKIKEGSGYEDLAQDLAALRVLYGKTSGAISGPITQQLLDRGGALADMMKPEIDAMQSGDLVRLLVERRQTAFLASKAHRQVRRAILFLREEEGDADTIIPSLHQYGGGRPASKDKDTLPVLNPSQPAAVVSPNPTASSTAAKPPTVVVKSANPMDNPFDDEPFDTKK
jgi:hypothetical protein